MTRLLVVEDCPIQAEMLQSILESEGFEVDLALDGLRALALLQEREFDLVMTDVGMPGLSGYDLCRRIKADPLHDQVPIILLTSLDDPVNVIQGLECGANYFVTKPFQSDYLVDRIRHILAARTAPRTREGGTKVHFLGREFTITSGREQILDFLTATFEDIVRTNRELQKSQAELRQAKAQVEHYAHQLEGQVRSSQDKNRCLMEQANDGIFLLDRVGTVLEANGRAEEILGRPCADLVGSLFESLVPPGELDQVKARFQQLLAEGSVRMDNLSLVAADGRSVCVDLSASLAEIDGDRVVLVIARDVTERVHLERQLRQALKMEAVGRLAGGVAHDFNNLLTIINGSSEILLKRTLSQPVRELTEEIYKAGERAASLTRQLLGFSRQQVIAPKVLDLNTVVADMEKMLCRLIGEDIRLTSILGRPLGWVKADPGQLEQILLNLAVNARDAMPQGGQLILQTADVVLEGAFVRQHPEVQSGRYVMLAVTDTGCGMDEETKTHIFEPFFTTKELGQGTGLGLAMVYGNVKQSGGYIYVESEPGKGSTFKIFLPRVEAPVAARPAAGAWGPCPSGRETLLMVEDESAVRALTRHALQLGGYNVLEAGSAEEALQVSADHHGPIQLLVTDVVMPQMSGRQLAESLGPLRPDMKVLYLSGYTDDAVLRHGLLKAESAFLQKPFTINSLLRKVREVLDQGPAPVELHRTTALTEGWQGAALSGKTLSCPLRAVSE